MEDQEEIFWWKLAFHAIQSSRDRICIFSLLRPFLLRRDVIYTVKPGTKTDTKVRLRGKGVPSIRNSQVRGDHYVTLVIQTPERLSSEAKEALKKFDALTGNTLNQSQEELESAKKGKKKGFMDKMKEAFDD